jgi:hypothetical protein
MKYLLILLFLFSFSSAWALPECKGSPHKGDDLSIIEHWDNCEGTHTFNAGDKYVGEFKYGLPDGQGTYYFLADNEFKGDKYAGEFKDGKKNGQGTYTHTSGNKYVGEYKDGKKNGQGTYTWADGAKYEGEFKDSKKHGQGTFTFPDGRIQEGQWRNGKYIGKKEYEDEVIKLEEVEELYKNKIITNEERQKMRNKILGIN